MNAATLDAEVWAMVESIIMDPDRIAEQIVATFAADDPTEVDREALERRIAEVTRAERKQLLIIEALDDEQLSCGALARLRQQESELRRLLVID